MTEDVTVKLTRQRIKSNMGFATTGEGADPTYRKRRLKKSAEEDTERDWGGGWHVTRVEVVKVKPDRFNTEKVIAIVTETKTVKV